jgi:HEAT repeat protein
MKAKTRWLVLGGVGAVAVVVLWAALRSPEPVYEGKPVSYWLNLGEEAFARPATILPGGQMPQGPNKLLQARQAIGAIGPKALPYVAARMGGPLSPLKRWYLELLARLPGSISNRLPRPGSTHGLNLFMAAPYFTAVTERAGTNGIPTLVALSSASNPQTRRLALLHLARLAASDHRQTVPVFERALRDVDLAVRFDALRQLCQMAGTDSQVAPILTAYLNEVGTNLPGQFRLEVLAVLGGGGPRMNPAAARSPSLSLATSNANIWERAFAALAEWQQVLTPEAKQRVFTVFQSAFNTIQAESQVSLQRAFENLPLTAQQERELLVPLLAKGLTATNVSVRAVSAGMLSQLGAAAEPALPALIASLEDSAPRVRTGAMQALGRLGPKAAPAVPSLVRRLKEEPLEEMFVWNVARALGQIGPPAKEAVPTLLQMAKETKGYNRSWLLGAVVAMDPQNPELVPVLLSVLKPDGKTNDGSQPTSEDRNGRREETHGRYYAARLLGNLGPAAASALPALRQMMLEDEDLEPRLEAMEAILKIAPQQGADLVPVMIEALRWGESDSHRTPAIVARLLGQIGPRASSAVVPELVKLLDDKEVLARLTAAEALAKVSPEHKAECLATLHHLMEGNYGLSFRFRTIKGLWHVAPDDPQIMPELIKLLLPNNEFPADEPLQLLGEMGPAAQTAVPQLRALLEGHDWRLRRAAREVLERMEGGSAPRPGSSP